jgi:hypothetical protein
MDLNNLDKIKDVIGDTVSSTKQKVKTGYKPTTGKKKVLLGVLIILLGALGLEATNNDFDLGKLLDGQSLSEAKVMRDKTGNVVTDGSGKPTDEYNCEDFANRSEAQTFFDNAGGVQGDTNRLDGNKDGNACEHLPVGKK